MSLADLEVGDDDGEAKRSEVSSLWRVFTLFERFDGDGDGDGDNTRYIHLDGMLNKNRQLDRPRQTPRLRGRRTVLGRDERYVQCWCD
jgi:hypothetical protein